MRTNFKNLYKCVAAGLALVTVLPACKKQDVVTPNLEVSVEKTIYAVNEPVVFNFTGTADVVSFYSGAAGSEYKYKDRVTVSGKPQLTFTSYRVGANPEPNTLQVMMSKDFTNVFTADDIQKATWTDLTSRATLSIGTDNTASGVIDLSDQVSPNTPVYLAFHYKATKATVAQPNWTIKNISVTNVGTEGTFPIFSQNGSNWGTFSVLNSANNWTVTANTSLGFTGGAANTDDNDDWVISQPLQLDRVKPTYAVSVKPSVTTKLTKYTFAGYTAAGTYTVTFESTNANKWGIEKTIKEITITVQ